METYNSIEVTKQLVKDGKISQEIAETIFPELKESEDEKILRSLKEGFAILNGDEEWYNGITNSEMLAWLEKQGSQNLANSAKTCKVEPKFKVGDKIKYVGEPVRCAERIIAIRNDAYYFSEVVSLPFIEQDKWELVGQKPVDKVEQNPAWSDEYEKNINGILMVLESWDRCHISSAGLPSLIPQYISWLKSLKNYL